MKIKINIVFAMLVWMAMTPVYTQTQADKIEPWLEQVFPTTDECLQREYDQNLYQSVWENTKDLILLEMPYLREQLSDRDIDFLFRDSLTSQYTINYMPDMNQDGECEFGVTISGLGGSGGAPRNIFTQEGDDITFVTETNSEISAYYSPKNGWLRYKDYSAAGVDYGHRYFYEFIDGEYQMIYLEEWENGELIERIGAQKKLRRSMN